MPVVQINGKSHPNKTITLPAVRGVVADDGRKEHNRLERRRKMHIARREQLFSSEQIDKLSKRLKEALHGSREDIKRDPMFGKNVVNYNPAQTLKSLAVLKDVLKTEYSLKLSKKDDKQITQRFSEFMKEAESALREIYSFKIPANPSYKQHDYGEMPILFNTPFETNAHGAKDDFFEKHAELMTDDGDFKTLAKRFEWLREGDKSKALKLVYDPIKKLSEEVWSKLNRIAGNEGFHKLEHLTKERSILRNKPSSKALTIKSTPEAIPNPFKTGNEYADLNYKKIVSQIKQKMEIVLDGKRSLAWGRRQIGKMLRTLKETNHNPINFTKAKVIAAMDFAKSFLRRGENVIVPKEVIVHGENKDFVIRRDQVEEISRLGHKILKAYNAMDALAA